MTVLLQDFLSGNLGTTLTSGASGAQTDSSFAGLPAVTGSDTLKLVLDPDGTAGDPEIITITAHTASSTTATISRASEGTTARQHLSSTKWVNAVTTTDFNRLGFDGTITADLTGNVTGDVSGTAGVATTVTLTDEGADATCFPVFAQTATGNVALETDASALTYDATNGSLAATTFVGALTGNATSATGLAAAVTIGGVSFDGTAAINLPGVNTSGTQNTSGTAAVATKVTLTDESSDTTCFPVFAGAATGDKGLETDASALTYNAATGDLAATALSATTVTASGVISGDSLLLAAGAQVDGTITASSGSEASPGISFTGDTDTGIYRSAADTMYLVAGGNGSAEIKNNGFALDLGVNFSAWPATGSGDAAEWVATGFGNFFLQRNSSLRSEKENIQDLGDELTANMIDQVEPKLWNRIHSPGIPEIGPIAEDLEAISPHLGAHGFNEDGTTFLTGINRSTYLALLVLAVKDIRTRLAALEG